MTAVVTGLAVSVVAVGSSKPLPVAAAAGTPGVPGNATVIFTEDFENNSSLTVDPPQLITEYVGATGQTYYADDYWNSRPACNGLILAEGSAGTGSLELCKSDPAWQALKILSGKLSRAFGKPGDQFTVASYTNAGHGVRGEYTQIQTQTPIDVPEGGAFLTMSVDTGAHNCNVSSPRYYMKMSNGSGEAVPLVSDLISPCRDPDAIVDSANGKDAFLTRTVGDTPALVDWSTIVLTLDNQNVSGDGNDATIDNLTLWDVSPQLDKVFDPPVVDYGSTSTARFFVTNTYSPNGAGEFTRLDAKPGWQFTDLLPDGISAVGTPTTGTGAEECANFGAEGTTADTVVATGDLIQDQVYCVIEVPVTADAPGTYTNAASDVTTIGVKPPNDADVTFVAKPKLALVKSALYNDTNGDGLHNAGDTIDYNFVATNLGNVPLINLAINDPVVGPVTCEKTTLAVGEEVTCVSDSTYVITQADVDAGAKYNVATADAANSFDPTDVVDATDNTTTPLTPSPKLELVKSAGQPVDVNASGLTDAGDTIQYTFAVTNTGNVTMSNLRIDDPLAGPATCDTPTLAPGATAVCTADSVYIITENDETAGSVDNTATAYGTTPEGAETPSNTDETSTPVMTPAPSLLFEKAAGDPVDVNESGLTDAGDTIQYTFTVTNNGNVPVSGITVTDDLAGPVTCESTILLVGASTDCSADAPYVITEADEANGSVDNVAFGSGTDPDGGKVVSNEDDTTTPVSVPKPSLLLEKFASPAVDVNRSGITDAGDTIRFSFKITNNGNVPITNIVVVDELAGPVTCAADTLAPAASTDCIADNDYVITEADEAAGSVVNVALATGTDPDGETITSEDDQTTTEVVKPAPGLSIEKEALDSTGRVTTGPVGVGTALTYRFTVTNTGNVVLTNISVNDPLVGKTTCKTTTLAPGASTVCTADAPYIVTNADGAAGAVKNTATATATDPDGDNVLSPPASVTVTIVRIFVPRTGQPVTRTIIFAALLAGLGLGLVRLSRRSRTRSVN